MRTSRESIEERIVYLRNLEDRKLEVIRIIEEQGKLTGELKQSITQAVKLAGSGRLVSTLPSEAENACQCGQGKRS